MSEENEVSNETVVDNGTENVTQESAQNEYIAESKKYRKRAQEAENQLSEIKKQLQEQENTKLKEKEEFKTLAEKFEAEVESLSPYKEKYESIVNQRKEVLLSSIPEEQREQFKNKDLDVLEFMVSQLKPKTPSEPSVRATVKGKPMSDEWHNMSKQDKERNWKDIVKSFAKK